MFMLVVLDYISDWYSVYKVPRASSAMQNTFQLINRLRGQLRDDLEANPDEDS
jgi:hypothetical protein